MSFHLTVNIYVYPSVFIEQIAKSKLVGLWRGLKETLGFKPFFHVLMLNFLSWMAFQVSELHVNDPLNSRPLHA